MSWFVHGLGFMGLRFEMEGLAYRVLDLGLNFQGSGIGIYV